MTKTVPLVVILGLSAVGPFAGRPLSAQTALEAETGTSQSRISFYPYRQGWLGGDAAYSVPLSPGRTLWLFGDTFIGAPTATSAR